MLNEFIQYLQSQVGQPYLWGGQQKQLYKVPEIKAILDRFGVEANV